MANATITGTASNFGSISGVLAGEAGTVAGTITGAVAGSLTGSVGVPGPGVPSDGLEGQILAKASDTSFDTEWIDNYATELRIVARNETGSTLAKGTVVYINGASGNKPTLAKALATGDATSAQTVGMVSADIPNNQNGEVTVRGLLAGLDTSAFAAGTQLYLSGTTAGTVTSTKPSAPVHLVYVGIVSRQHVNQGQVEVAVMNGFEITELHDVKITSVSNGQVLKYDSAQGLWVNGTDSSGVAWGGITGTLSNQTDLQTALDAKATAADYLSKAGNLSGLADTSAARSNLGLGTMATATASDYSTTTVANGLYYPLSSNPAGYLTTAPVTSVAGKTGAVTLTNTDISGLGTMATATATDYLAKAGNLSGLADLATSRSNLGLGTMATETASNYLTTSAASSTYAPLASPGLTGTPTAPTAAVDTNTTQVATTAYVIGQGYLKSATASSTYAPLASPALTGTPTAPTASAGTNTTQIATTAFVQQEVPAASTTAAGKVELATVAEALQPSSSTLGMTPDTTREMLLYPGYIQLYGGGNASVSGAGASSTFTFASQRYHAMRTPNASTAGFGAYIFDYSFSGIGMAAMTRGSSSLARKWNSRIWVSGRTVLGEFAETVTGMGGNSNCTARVMLGGRTTAATGGMLNTENGIGWRVAGGGSQALVLTVSNGTTLTEVTSSFTPVLKEVFDWKIYSDGTGNVTLWVNDSQVATTTGGPTTSTAETYNCYLEIIEQTASSTGPFGMCNFGSKVFWSQP